MYRDINFYNLSEKEQRRLIRSKRVATSTELLKEIPDSGLAVRVFEKSLEQLVLERLESGRYTIHELAEGFSVGESDVRQIINKFRRRGRDDFTSESFKYNLLSEWNGVIRVKNASGGRFQYSLTTIPFFARIGDPTLTVSLLDAEKKLLDFPIIAEQIPPNTASELDEIYALLFGDFWEIDPQKIFDEITDYERTYVETSVCPLPIIKAAPQFRKVRDRFAQPDTVYGRFRNLEKSIERLDEEFAEIARRGQLGVRMYQAASIEFFDMLQAAKLEDERLVPVAKKAVENVILFLHPTSMSSIEDRENVTRKITLEDEIMAVLDEDWMTVDQVYHELPADINIESPKESVRETLDMHVALGIISSRNREDIIEYSSKPGTVNLRDVL